MTAEPMGSGFVTNGSVSGDDISFEFEFITDLGHQASMSHQGALAGVASMLGTAAAAAAGNALTERRDLYANHMLAAVAGLNRTISETEILASGNALDVRASFMERDVEGVIGLVAMMRQMGR